MNESRPDQSLVKKIDNLADLLPMFATRMLAIGITFFGMSASVGVQGISPAEYPMPVPRAGRVTRIVLDLAAAVTTDITLTVRKNGGNAENINIAAGTGAGVLTLNSLAVDFAVGDRMSLMVYSGAVTPQFKAISLLFE